MVASWYSEDNREVPMEVLNEETEDPFAKGEAVKFDCFPSGSTTACWCRFGPVGFYFPASPSHFTAARCRDSTLNS